jgi:alpha-mannosidase
VFIWSYDQYDAEASFISPSEETRVPLKGVFYEGPRGPAALSNSGIVLSRKGILVTAFKPLAKEEGMLLRLWEQAGQDGTVNITLPEGSDYKKAYPCNLRDEISGDGIPISERSFELDIQANQPLSFILR